MRLKEEIIRSGDFSLPSSPEKEVPGMLSISDGGAVKLELTHPGHTNIKALFGDNTEGFRIFGHVEKDGPVTLDQCHYVTETRSMVHGRWTTSHVIWANRAFIGFSYNEDADPRFDTVIFSVEGIDEWVGISGIEVDEEIEKRTLTISYNQPEEVSLDLHNGMQLLITFVPTFPGLPSAKSAEVSQKTYFKLVSQEERALDEFTSIAEKITAFLCFVMNEIICLESVTATSDNLRHNVGGSRAVTIYVPSWPYSKDKPKINEMDMLFRLGEIQNCAQSIINKWLQNYEQIAPALDLYFLTKAGTLPTLNIQFLALAQALEAFHRRTSDEKHMDEVEFKEIRKALVNKCPKRERNWFAQKLNYANELTLKNRLERMIEPFDCLIDDERRPQLIEHIKNTRNYLTHYDPKLEKKAAKGLGLELLCRKMNALFRLQFLKLIGFDEQEIDDIVDKCTRLKGECNL